MNRTGEHSPATGNTTVVHGHMAENIVHFARALRNAGLAVGPSRVVDATKAIEVTGITRRQDLYWAMHCVFVSKREHQVLFDAAFEMFWTMSNIGLPHQAAHSDMEVIPHADEKPKAAASRTAAAIFGKTFERKAVMSPEAEVDSDFAISSQELLKHKDFAQMTSEEIADAQLALRSLTLPVKPIKTRRFKAELKGERIDLRKSARRNLATGGEFLSPVMKNPIVQPPPIVALCDISGSMSQYSRIFLHFMHALTESRSRNRGRVHSFVFGTHLTNVTRALKHKDPDEALAICGAEAKDWSGGTRIGSALREFNQHWSRRVLGQGAVVLLITDGLERENDEDLEFAMDRLHRSCRQLIWLNPLLRYEKFQAKAKGIRTMLPHVDQFRPVHSLDAISDLCDSLSKSERAPQHSNPSRWKCNAA